MEHLATFLTLELKWQLRKDQKGSAISTKESLSCLLINASGMRTPVHITPGRSWSCQLIWSKSPQGLWGCNTRHSFVMPFPTQDSIVTAGKCSRREGKKKKVLEKKEEVTRNTWKWKLPPCMSIFAISSSMTCRTKATGSLLPSDRNENKHFLQPKPGCSACK